MRGRFVDISGRQFGRLSVLSREGAASDGTPLWACRCECGGAIVARGNNLVRGTTASCGCLKRERNAQLRTKHGDVGSSEYRSWSHLRRRCLDPSHPRYADYGGRGITVCERWRDSYAAFLEDMGRKPSPKHSIDRIDNDGNYEPGNCRWATAKEQNSNTRRTKRQSETGACA